MDNLYKPISRKEILSALVAKFGGVEVARYYLNDALSDLQTIEVGIDDNNPLRATKAVSSLREALENIRTLIENKDYKNNIEKSIKSNTK